MKKLKHFILGAITATTLLVMIINASANEVLKDIKAHMAYDIRVILDGKEIHTKDVVETELKPIIYQDRAYLPLRSLCDELGVYVEWDDDTKTIFMTTERNDKIVATINENCKIRLSEFEYAIKERFLLHKYGIDQIGNFEKEKLPFEDTVKQKAFDYVINNNILSMIAKKKGIKLNHNNGEIDKDIKRLFESFNNFTTPSGFTSELVESIQEKKLLSYELCDDFLKNYTIDNEKLEDLLYQDEKYRNIQEEGYDYYLKQYNQYTFKHILFTKIDTDTYEPLNEQVIAEKKLKAEKILSRLKTGEDFEKLAITYSEDIDEEYKGTDYTIRLDDEELMHDDMVDIIDGLVNIKTGEISNVIDTDVAFIILKLEEIIEASQEDIDNLKQEEQDIIDMAKYKLNTEALNNKIDEWKSTYDIKINNDVWDNINIEKLKDEIYSINQLEEISKQK